MESIGIKGLNEIEYILSQSKIGIHLLFEKDMIVEILSEPTDSISYFSMENLNKAQDILTELIKKPSIREKKDYLNCLPREKYELLVRTYFNIVENAVLESTPEKH